MQMWYHQASREWLEAREGFLTASQIDDLWPLTTTGRRRPIVEEDYIKALFNSTEINYDSVNSYGPAARGHILEPYALEELRKMRTDPSNIFHWDDAVIYKGGSSIAFSPDGLDIPQPETGVLFNVSELPTINEVFEIKSYRAAKHYQTFAEGKFAIERRQVATQMYICEEATIGSLVLYNPRLIKGALFLTQWTREDLEEDLAIIGEIDKQFTETKIKYSNAFVSRKGMSETDILKELQSLSIN